jgi:hypothetical protein
MNVLELDNCKKTDDEKITEFKKQDEKFYKDFPIVARYMVCMDAYSRQAFKRFLNKLVMNNQKRQTPGDAKAGDAENDWIELQADYVKFLYQEYNRERHVSNEELNRIWRDTYNSLKKEFGDFRELYQQKVKKIEEDKKKHTAKVAKDVIGRLTTIQEIDDATQLKLYHEMQDTLFLQRSSKNLKRLLSRMELTHLASVEYEGRGRNEEAEKIMAQDVKVKEAKNKIEPVAKVRNPVKYYYDELDADHDKGVMQALYNLCALEAYRHTLLELNIEIRERRKQLEAIAGSIIEGTGLNEEEATKWETERIRWKEVNPQLNENGKIFVPYSRNLIRAYYYNNERLSYN